MNCLIFKVRVNEEGRVTRTFLHRSDGGFEERDEEIERVVSDFNLFSLITLTSGKLFRR